MRTAQKITPMNEMEKECFKVTKKDFAENVKLQKVFKKEEERIDR